MTRGGAAWLAGRDCRLDLSRPRLMGILNVTPDSFSDGGDYLAAERALRQGLRLLADGADLIDIGGESSRPGAAPVSQQEELDRVVPVIERLRNETDLPLSVDTTKSAVARAALLAGANYINDISGLRFDAEMAAVAAESGAGLFLMHTRGTPRHMQKQTAYADLLAEVTAYLRQGIDLALAAGVSPRALAVDPGIGFGKSVAGNLTLLRHLERLHELGYPVLLGTSRKSFIGRILDQDDPRRRLAGTLATLALAVDKGVQIFRVHDVRAARETLLVAWAIREGRLP
ncbi:MAG TPA: dihydropteroate synthase [Geopsychrobacteraceae bacterium]